MLSCQHSTYYMLYYMLYNMLCYILHNCLYYICYLFDVMLFLKDSGLDNGRGFTMIKNGFIFNLRFQQLKFFFLFVCCFKPWLSDRNVIFTSRISTYLQTNSCFLKVLSKRHLVLGSIGGLDKAVKSQRQEPRWVSGLEQGAAQGDGEGWGLPCAAAKISGSALSLAGD